MKSFKRYYGHDIDANAELIPFAEVTGADPTMSETLEGEKEDILKESAIGHTVDIYEVTFKLLETVVVTKKLVKNK